MRLAARVLLLGTGWVAFKQLMGLVGFMMDLFSKLSKGIHHTMVFFKVYAFLKTYSLRMAYW